MEKKDTYQLSVYLDRDLAAKVRAKAFQEGKRVAEVVRELLRAYVSGRKG